MISTFCFDETDSVIASTFSACRPLRTLAEKQASRTPSKRMLHERPIFSSDSILFRPHIESMRGAKSVLCDENMRK